MSAQVHSSQRSSLPLWPGAEEPFEVPTAFSYKGSGSATQVFRCSMNSIQDSLVAGPFRISLGMLSSLKMSPECHTERVQETG